MKLPGTSLVKIEFEALMTIAAFEILPMEAFYEIVLGDAAIGKPFSDKFEALGMEHHLIMNNLGTLGVVIVVILVLHFVQKFINWFQGIKCCRKSARRLASTLYYGAVLRTIMESYVISLMSSLINLETVDFTESDSWTLLNTCIAWLFLVILLIFPFFSILYMLGNWDMLQHRYIHGRFGEIHMGYSLKSRQMLVYQGLDYLRKILLCASVTLWSELFIVQIMSLFYTSIGLIIIAGSLHVRISKFDKHMDIFNEYKLIVIMYHLMLFNEFVPSLEAKDQIGFSCFLVLTAGLTINMSVIIVDPVKVCRKKAKVCFAKRRSMRVLMGKRHIYK